VKIRKLNQQIRPS